MSPRLWKFRITDIISSINNIRSYVAEHDFERFQADRRTFDAVIMNFIIIGEAARHIPESITKRHSNVPWRYMIDMRNFSVHEYFEVDDSTIWECIQNDLPNLPGQLREVLERESLE